MQNEYIETLGPFAVYQPEPKQEPRHASIIEAAKAYRDGKQVTISATAYSGRHSDVMDRSFSKGDAIRYDTETIEPVSFKDWLIRSKVFFGSWFFGMDRVFYQFFIG